MESGHIEDREAQEALPAALSAPPREVTRLIRRRAWGERRVRLWWLLGVAMLAITFYYAVSRVYWWSDETNLIKRGAQVSGEVVVGGGNAYPKGMKRPLPADTVVDLEYEYKGQKYTVRGALAGRTEQIMTRTPIPIFIDPNNPTHWTARTTPASLVQELLPAIMLLPFVLVLLAMALVSHGRVLRIYRDGLGVPAQVVRINHSAAAPRSRLIGCAAHFGEDDRVIRILLPARKTPEVGESLWLLALPGRGDQAIPLALFE